MKINLKHFLLPLAAVLFLFSSCGKVSPRFERTLGTICYINLYEDGKARTYDEIFARLDEINTAFNIGIEGSDLYRINAASQGEEVFVGDDVFTVLEMSQKIAELTGGAFDVSIEPLVSLWHINSDSPHVATPSEIAELLPLVDYKNIVLNAEHKSVCLLKEGMKLDLGGIAKGFAADEVAKICKARKIRRAVIDLGGNIYVYGKKAKGEAWKVGVKNPELPDSAPLLKITVPAISVVTSGLYERFFEEGEKRYHHILSPETGAPVENELSSVSVLCVNSMLADALTTSFFVLGREKSLALLPALREVFALDISAVFIEKNHSIYFSDAFPYECEVLYDDWRRVF